VCSSDLVSALGLTVGDEVEVHAASSAGDRRPADRSGHGRVRSLGLAARGGHNRRATDRTGPKRAGGQ
jgi:hypothetical protein